MVGKFSQLQPFTINRTPQPLAKGSRNNVRPLNVRTPDLRFKLLFDDRSHSLSRYFSAGTRFLQVVVTIILTFILSHQCILSHHIRSELIHFTFASDGREIDGLPVHNLKFELPVVEVKTGSKGKEAFRGLCVGHVHSPLHTPASVTMPNHFFYQSFWYSHCQPLLADGHLHYRDQFHSYWLSHG